MIRVLDPIYGDPSFVVSRARRVEGGLLVMGMSFSEVAIFFFAITTGIGGRDVLDFSKAIVKDRWYKTDADKWWLKDIFNNFEHKTNPVSEWLCECSEFVEAPLYIGRLGWVNPAHKYLVPSVRSSVF